MKYRFARAMASRRPWRAAGHDVVRVVWSDDGTGLDERLRARRRGRRVPRAPRPRRGRRLRPGPARADGHPVHGQRRPRERARHGQAQGQGDVPAPQRADASVLRGEPRRPRRPRGAPRELRLPGDRQAAPRGLVGRALPRWTASASSPRAVEQALAFDEHVLVERFVRATEVHVGILDGRVLGAIEVEPKSGLYDYRAKYTAGMTEYVCPPRLPATRLRGVMNLAERAARALGCTGACRVDLLVTEGENEYVLEVNTLPGMTPTSLLPKIAAGRGHRLSVALRGHPRGRAPAGGAAGARGRAFAPRAAAVARGLRRRRRLGLPRAASRGDRWPRSPSSGSASASARCSPSTTSRWRSTSARSTPSSARTAPARGRC